MSTTTTTVLRSAGCQYVVRTVLAQRRRMDAALDLSAPNDYRQDSLRATYAEVAQSAVPGFRIEHAPADKCQERMLRRSTGLTAATTVDGGTQELGNVTVWVDGEGWTNLYGRAHRYGMAQRSATNGAQSAGRPRKVCEVCEALREMDGAAPDATCGKVCAARERKRASRQAARDRDADLANARADRAQPIAASAAVAVPAPSGMDVDH